MAVAPFTLVPSDRSIRDKAGEVLLFSWPEFVMSICEGACCFICGRPPAERKFNDEHIVPNWVLHAFDLHRMAVTLPNGNQTVYGNYKVPCCEACNTEMARKLEEKMSELVREGGNAIQDFLVAGGTKLVFTWIALIFLKLHLKDRRLRMHLDNRLGDDPISVDYIWENMHHLHAIARSFHIDATIEPEAVGSLFVFAVDAGARDFDLLTFTEAQTIFVQLGRTGIIAVFDDSCAANQRVGWILDQITGPVSRAQARELAVHFAMANIDLENRPRFWSHITDRQDVVIGGTTDDAPVFRPYDSELLGHLMAVAFPSVPPSAEFDREEAARRLRAGDLSFLADENGNFADIRSRENAVDRL